MPVKIKPFNHVDATEAEYQGYTDCTNAVRRERLPDDPPRPLAETIAQFQNLPDVMRLYAWMAWDDERVVAATFAALPLTDNPHLMQFDIIVLPEYRRQGLARQMLAFIVETARTEERTVLIADTNANIPADAPFMERIGAQPGLESHANQLKLAKLDRDLIARWIALAGERAAGFELGWWFGPFPDRDLDDIVTLHQLVNDVPLGDLDVQEFKVDAHEIREEEKSLFARGTERWVNYVRERATGKMAGYSDVK